MKKNNLIGFVLLGAVIFWMSFNQEPAKIPKKQEDPASTNVVGSKTTSPSNTQSAPVLNSDKNTTGDQAEASTPVITSKKYTVETDKFIITLNSKGAAITSILLKDLKDKDGAYPELFENQESTILDFALEDFSYSNELFSVDSNTPSQILVTDSTTLSFNWKNSEGHALVRTYTFSNNGSEIQHDITIDGFTPRTYSLKWNAGLRETERIIKKGQEVASDDSYAFSEFIYKSGDDVSREEYSEKEMINEESGTVRWVGMRRKYVAALINFERSAYAKVAVTPFKISKDPESGDRPTFSLDITENLTSDNLSFKFVILPLKYADLKDYGQGYEEIIVIGYSWFFFANVWFPALCGLVLWLLNAFYGLIPNYGVAIILLTLLVKIVTMPFAIKQIKSMGKMKEHKPALDVIRAKHKSDPRKVQEKTMEYYREKGINPLAQMGGCLPMVMQMPIFISLFVILGRAVELRYAPFAGWITDLSLPDIIYSGIQIPLVMPYGLGILPFIMAISSYFQSKQTMTDPNQKAMIYMMPAMMFFFSNQMPSGLVLYWTISNVFGILQHWFLNRKTA
ncbi:MAG: membrane protein insertase YidC [Reichenbachiella sp.]